MDIVSSQTGTSDNAMPLITNFIGVARSLWPHILNVLESKITWAALAVLAIVLIVIAQKRRIKKALEIQRGWVTYAVEKFKKDRIKNNLGQRLINFANKLRHPSIASLFAALTFLLMAGLLPWFLNKFVWTCSNESSSNNIANILLTLWQVQIGLAGAALPILIFVIEMTKDEGRAATKSSEVLIRETWIFPIIVLALSTAIKIGFDIHQNSSSQSAELIDLLLFFICILLTIFAYYRAMRLMFSPALLRSKSIKLMKEKMEESILYSAETRAGNNWLLKNLKESGIEWYPFSPGREERERFYFVDAQRLGQIVNINVENFRAFIEQLDLKLTGPETSLFSLEDSEETAENDVSGASKPKQVVYIVKTFREYITDTDSGRTLILIEKSTLNTFNKFDADQWANKRIFKIEATDEG